MPGTRETAARPAGRLAAWSVHLLTASGAVWGLWALDAIARARFGAALGWMALAVLVDGVDGMLARRARVRHVLPSIDGSLLDNLVDYLNYVVVPAFFLLRAGVLPAPIAPFGAAAICLASAFQFTHVEAKTAEHFRGFPSYWNVVVCYLLLLRPGPWWAVAIVTVLCLLVFAPVTCVYPTRTRELRGLTLALTTAWATVIGASLWHYPTHARWPAVASLAYVVYYVVLSLWLWRARDGSQAPAGPRSRSAGG